MRNDKTKKLFSVMNGITECCEKMPVELDYLKSIMCINLREITENILDHSRDNPIPLLINVFEEYLGFMEVNVKNLDVKNKLIYNSSKEDVVARTTSLYGKLFKEFTNDDVSNEAYDLLKQRLQKNDINMSNIIGKKCLDDGCGGGRYSIALKKMGALSVDGVDGSEEAILDARSRAKQLGITGCRFSVQDVLNLDFQDNSFDFVMSYGVLHHTTDIFKGIKECYRVLRNGGSFFLFLMSCNGLRYDIVKWLRLILKDVNPSITRSFMIAMGYDPRKIFNFMDNLHVPIHVNVSKNELEKMLLDIGFSELKWLKRDVQTERYTHPTELIYQKAPYAKLKYGDGAYKYFCIKK